jgi:hypothetical protein
MGSLNDSATSRDEALSLFGLFFKAMALLKIELYSLLEFLEELYCELDN